MAWAGEPSQHWLRETRVEPAERSGAPKRASATPWPAAFHWVWSETLAWGASALKGARVRQPTRRSPPVAEASKA